MASQESKPHNLQDDDAPVVASGPRTNPQLKTGGLKQVTLVPASAEQSAQPTQPSAELHVDSLSAGDDDSRRQLTAPPHEELPSAAPATASRRDAYLGATIDGRYLVEKKLGEGGMGVVYQCRHTIIDKKVAMKVLRADLANNDELTERFLNEARSASSIGNPHIIDISDFGRLPDGATYFVMEFLSGQSLVDLVLTKKPIDHARIGDIVIQLTEGLAAAHAVGIVHRDLKPDNIFLVSQGARPDFVKILDFGIAKASSAATRLTQAGQVFGTPHYMSPEQAAGHEVDQRSDIYALGVILYELTTGQLPFDAEHFMAVLTQHMYREPTPPEALDGVPPLPAGLQEIILTCMAKEPEQRFADMYELGDALRGVFHDLLPSYARASQLSTDDYGTPRRYQRSSATSIPRISPTTHSKNRTFLVIAAGCLLALLGLGIMSYLQRSPSARAEATMQQPVAPSQSEPSNVALAVEPLDAHVYLGAQDLGKSPVMLSIGAQALQLEVRAPGYRTKTLTVDGTQGRLSVALEKLPESANETPVATSSPAPSQQLTAPHDAAPSTTPKAAASSQVTAKPTTAKPTTAPQPSVSAKPSAQPKTADSELVNPWD